MKKITTLILTACFAVTMLTGCKTTSGGTTVDPVATGAMVQALATAGASFAVTKDKNAEGYLKAAAIICRTAANSGQYDPVEIQKVIDKMTVNELQTPEIKACLVAVFGVYKSYWGAAVSQKLDQAQWVKPVLLGIADGIDVGVTIPFPQELKAPGLKGIKSKPVNACCK